MSATVALNAAGLVLGFAGAVLVVIFGLPSIDVLNDGAYIETQVTPKMRTYLRWSRVGIALITVGFLCQLAAIWTSRSP